jgi:uncharacterized membrane protein AbrB (regulator of aidB expression)
MRRHLSSHWRVWLVIAVVVVVANEILDRNVSDHKQHIDGDVIVTIVVLLIAFFASYLVARQRQRPSSG